ncbi:MAG TPA: undecaprenyl-diphosphatase UppP [Caldilineaceae bacterium]|nr:undecaprenyl-diphosphatase UppP [Caldilineaceae bacterium]
MINPTQFNVSEILRALVLGVVQGATEFIPVSSSAHLVIMPWLAGWPDPSLLFDTVLHWGTLLALLLVFWRELWAIFIATLQSIGRRSLADPNARLGWYIVVGTLPAVGIGYFFEGFFETLYSDAAAAGRALFITALLLTGSELLARRRARGVDLTSVSWDQAIAIGFAQAVALVPGISRSGSTIAMGLGIGLRREAAARYSFLLGIPAVFGAGLLQLLQALDTDPTEVTAHLPALVVGFIASALVGYLVIRWLLAYLRSHTLYVFAVYCLLLGALVVALASV